MSTRLLKSDVSKSHMLSRQISQMACIHLLDFIMLRIWGSTGADHVVFSLLDVRGARRSATSCSILWVSAAALKILLEGGGGAHVGETAVS